MIDELLELIKQAFLFIKNFIRRVINGILNFTRDILIKLRSWNLRQNTDVPFIADMNFFKKQLETAPVKDVGLFIGVYSKDTGEIRENPEVIEADSLDEKTRSVMGDEPLVVLA